MLAGTKSPGLKPAGPRTSISSGIGGVIRNGAPGGSGRPGRGEGPASSPRAVSKVECLVRAISGMPQWGE
jgi:hypothetical protein